ncbi:MAG: hypothetical protein ACRDDX_05950 [Cellulosilyticaceae bacterium]
MEYVLGFYYIPAYIIAIVGIWLYCRKQGKLCRFVGKLLLLTSMMTLINFIILMTYPFESYDGYGFLFYNAAPVLGVNFVLAVIYVLKK